MREQLGILTILLASGLLLVQCSSNQSGSNEPKAYHHIDSLNSLLLGELSSKKVVFFGDSYPGHITYAQDVIAFLNSWLESVETRHNDTKLPRELILALEIDDSTRKQLELYLKTGDRYPLIRRLIDEQIKCRYDVYQSRLLSVDCLRFYHELRLLCIKIDSINVGSPNQSVSLRIIGVDPEPPFDYRTIRSLKKPDLWRIKSEWDRFERGQRSSSHLMSYLREYPECRILVFCEANLLTRETGQGIFVPHFLDSLVGRSNVAVFQTSRMPRDTEPGFEVASPGKAIEEYSENQNAPDFIVRQSANPPSPMPMFLVKSENILQSLVGLSERYAASQDSMEKSISREMLSLALDQLRRSHLSLQASQNQQIASYQYAVSLSGRRTIFPVDIYVATRKLISKFDAVQDILLIDRVMTTFAPSTEFRNGLVTILENLPIRNAPTIDTTGMHYPIRVGALSGPNWAKVWKEMETERKKYMLMQLFWIGTPGEVTKAAKSLQTITRNDFETSRQWENWWYQMEGRKR